MNCLEFEKAEKLLRQNGQLQLLRYYDELDPSQKQLLLDDISRINFSVTGRIGGGDGVKNIDNISTVNANDLEDIRKHGAKYREEGLKLLKDGKIAAVILAGGQGTRLGYDRPKGTFDIGVTRKLYIFQQLINNALDVTLLYGGYFRIFVMTSRLNHDETVSFFKENEFFGYPEDKISFYNQDEEPVCGLDGKILLAQKHRVAFSPNGNGGWYSSFVNSGLGDILRKESIEWLNVFSVDNVLQRICDPIFIGATVLSGCNCGAKVVRKTCPEERVGVLCTIDGKPDIIEYYELPQEIASAKNGDGRLKYPYGVILNYLFKVNVLNELIDCKLPYHLAKKKVAHIEDGALINPAQPNSYKFETLIVDMIRFMETCFAFEVEREREFAPVKNATGVDSVDSARELLKLNGVKL